MGVDQSQGLRGGARARLRTTTVVFLVGDIPATIRWYQRLGFVAESYPPGFAILRRDDIEIFLQQQDGYVRPDDPGAREREAWNVYIATDDVAKLHDEVASAGVTIARAPCRQEYGQIEFDVIDPNGYRLVFAQPVG